MANLYYETGQWDKSLQECQEALRLSHPTSVIYYDCLVFAYANLERFAQAKAAAVEALARNPDSPNIHERLLLIAYAEGDSQAAAKEIQWFTGKPEESQSLSLQARNAYFLGQRRKAKELYRRARTLLQRGNFIDQETGVLLSDAVIDAELGNCDGIRTVSETAALPYENVDPSQPAILALAFCGQPSQAQEHTKKISAQFPLYTLWHTVKLPAIEAALELRRGRPANAIELLQFAAPYDRTHPYAVYLRGLAYLEAGETSKASTEFQKILDHKGAYWMAVSRGPYYPLSYLGLARAAVMSGDTAKAKKAYRDFLTLWKDADPDLAPFIQARKEYAALP